MLIKQAGLLASKQYSMIIIKYYRFYEIIELCSLLELSDIQQLQCENEQG